jgi:hypothetical protein
MDLILGTQQVGKVLTVEVSMPAAATKPAPLEVRVNARCRALAAALRDSYKANRRVLRAPEEWFSDECRGFNLLGPIVRAEAVLSLRTRAPETDDISEALDILATWSMSGDDVDRKVRRVIRRARAQLRNLRASR